MGYRSLFDSIKNGSLKKWTWKKRKFERTSVKLLQHDFRKRAQHEKIPKNTTFAEQNGTCKYEKRMEDANKSIV